MKGMIIFQLPESLLQEFLQYIRDFDTSHEQTAFEIFMETDQPPAEIKAVLSRIKPGFPFMHDFKWKQ